MATYSLPDLLHKWSKGELTVEQTIGQLVQLVVDHEQRLTQLEKARPEARSEGRKPRP